MKQIAQRFSAGSSTDLSKELALALDSCRRAQPVLSAQIEHLMTRRMNEDARAFGISVSLAIWNAFHTLAPTRMDELTAEQWQTSEQLFYADLDMRRDDPDMLTDSDEVLAALQPAVLSYVRKVLQQTVEQAPDTIDLDDLDFAYRFVLIETISLSQAIRPKQTTGGTKPS